MRLLNYICVLTLSVWYLYSQRDSLHLSLPKHYFQTIVLVDYYQKPKVLLEPIDYVHQKLQSYQVKQSIVALSIPFYTKDILRKDSLRANIHLLGTGYFLSYSPNFAGLKENHILEKNGIGIRFIYNNGKRAIFFADFSPFSTVDKNDPENTRVVRIASLLLWSFSPSEKFNLRLGVTKSFMWGNRYYLPVIGFRMGALHKVYFSLQFPRLMSLNIPIKNKVQISLFTKPQGGLFTMSNKDTVYAAFLNENKMVYLGRYEFLSGLRIDVKPTRYVGFYLAFGRSINNYLALYSLRFNKNNEWIYRPFFRHKQFGKTVFFNIGIVGYFGKTRSYYHQTQIDALLHLNNEMGIGDNNTSVFQPTDNYQKKEMFKVDPQEISDLINSFDY